jgi:hypothetical protein
MSLRPHAALFGLVLTVMAPPAPAKDDAGWKDLFDGKSLDGWKASDFYAPGKVHVEDGAVVMDKCKIMTGVTYTRGDFPKMDYEFVMEAKKIDGDDFFCTTTFPVGDAFCSFVVGGWSGRVVGLSSIDGMDASSNETRTNQEFKNDRWYKVRVRVSQKRIEAWIDGDKLVDLDTTDRKISIRVECNASRPFGVSTYQTTGAIRNLRVRPLSDADKKEIAETKPVKKD